jgi:DNA-binding NarL/FixJ family response regulator
METLTDRELQVADLIHQGYIEKEIADRLCISTGTVHTHAKHIREKLNCRNIADITRVFITRLKIVAIVTASGIAICVAAKKAGIDLQSIAASILEKIMP